MLTSQPITARGQDAPLSRFRLVDTHEPDEAREQIGRIFCPHFLDPLGRRPAGFHARHHSAPGHGYSVNFVSYGASVEIDPGTLSRFFLLQIPVRGSALVRCGTSLAEAHAGFRASLLSPTLPTRMTWHEGCEKIIVLIDRSAMEAQFESLTHRKLQSIEFAAGIDLASAEGRSLMRHAELVLAAAEDPDGAPPAYLTLLRDGLTTLLLDGFSHSGSALIEKPQGSPAPGAVKRAEEFIEGHAAHPISMADIAAAAGVPLRSLQDAFKRARGMTLSEALLAVRLQHFRQALCAPPPGASVADIAYECGFGHLGRAAAAYHARYGEAPSQTLRRNR